MGRTAHEPLADAHDLVAAAQVYRPLARAVFTRHFADPGVAAQRPECVRHEARDGAKAIADGLAGACLRHCP